jgi:hypothetical protein
MKIMVPFVVACLCAFQAAPAAAANELGLSVDGTTWTDNLTTPLFPASFIWVPGCTESSAFWVRNQSSDKATLDVAILGSTVDSLMQTGDLAVTVRAADGSGSTTTTTGRHELIVSRRVNAGQTERIEVTVAFDPASTNQSQEKAVDLRFEVRLTQGSGPHGGGGPGHGNGHGGHHEHSKDDGHRRDPNGLLPGTGGPAWWLLPAGLLGVSTGWLTVAASRRRERKEPADV